MSWSSTEAINFRGISTLPHFRDSHLQANWRPNRPSLIHKTHRFSRYWFLFALKKGKVSITSLYNAIADSYPENIKYKIKFIDARYSLHSLYRLIFIYKIN